MTSLRLANDRLGGVLVDLNMSWDNEFALAEGPDVVPGSVPGERPAELPEPLLKVATLHQLIIHPLV